MVDGQAAQLRDLLREQPRTSHREGLVELAHCRDVPVAGAIAVGGPHDCQVTREGQRDHVLVAGRNADQQGCVGVAVALAGTARLSNPGEVAFAVVPGPGVGADQQVVLVGSCLRRPPCTLGQAQACDALDVAELGADVEPPDPGQQ